MRTGWAMTLGLGILAGTASPGVAQTAGSPHAPLVSSRAIPADTSALTSAPDLSVDARRDAELQRWIEAFTEWQAWFVQWNNRSQPGWFTSFRDRPEKPAPPAWLPEQCLTAVDDADPLVDGCALLADWRQERGPAQVRQVRAAVVGRQEEEPKTTWWKHVHFDVLWPAMQWRSSTYGVIGMHLATPVGGRLQVFTAPGAMLLNLPTRSGGRVWKVAANYGIGYKLLTFTMPGSRPASLHVNLAKTWLLSESIDLVGGRSTDFVGISITFDR
jgi:hypothetical protein